MFWIIQTTPSGSISTWMYLDHYFGWQVSMAVDQSVRAGLCPVCGEGPYRRPPSIMDGDHSLEMAEHWRVRQWLYLLQQREERIPEWATQFHPQKLSCKLQEDPRCGSYNFCRKLLFSSGEAWMIPFPIDGRTSTVYADEKVASEVAALKLIREQTDIDKADTSDVGARALLVDAATECGWVCSRVQPRRAKTRGSSRFRWCRTARRPGQSGRATLAGEEWRSSVCIVQ